MADPGWRTQDYGPGVAKGLHILAPFPDCPADLRGEALTNARKQLIISCERCKATAQWQRRKAFEEEKCISDMNPNVCRGKIMRNELRRNEKRLAHNAQAASRGLHILEPYPPIPNTFFGRGEVGGIEKANHQMREL